MLSEAIQSAGYNARLVSDSDEIQVIHTNIVQNIHDDEIVVCDVSGKNANVMFELGLRLAFDKPVIIVKDNATDYSFDTSPIKHIGYRKDLRFDDVIAFKAKVAAAITSTVKTSKADPEYSPFLRNFKHITAKKLGNEELTQAEFLNRKIDRIERAIENIVDRNVERNSFLKYSLKGVNVDKQLHSALLRDAVAKRSEIFIYISALINGYLMSNQADSTNMLETAAGRRILSQKIFDAVVEKHGFLEQSDFETMFTRAWDFALGAKNDEA
ncbi:hypothetical protein ASG39_04680 [Rhizobium sp. Leaf371]|nr:hypothetical protein ASG39_04680 [Rhizobium sp. Leaf371]